MSTGDNTPDTGAYLPTEQEIAEATERLRAAHLQQMAASPVKHLAARHGGRRYSSYRAGGRTVFTPE